MTIQKIQIGNVIDSIGAAVVSHPVTASKAESCYIKYAIGESIYLGVAAWNKRAGRWVCTFSLPFEYGLQYWKLDASVLSEIGETIVSGIKSKVELGDYFRG